MDILLLCAFWIVVPLRSSAVLRVRYYFQGPNIKGTAVNEAMWAQSQTRRMISKKTSGISEAKL
jgi:hypothetical protein